MNPILIIGIIIAAILALVLLAFIGKFFSLWLQFIQSWR